MRSRDPQNQGGGGAVETQNHGGLRDPGGLSNQGEVESREQKKGGRREPGEPQDQRGPIGQQDHGGLGEPGEKSNQGEQ